MQSLCDLSHLEIICISAIVISEACSSACIPIGALTVGLSTVLVFAAGGTDLI